MQVVEYQGKINVLDNHIAITNFPTSEAATTRTPIPLNIWHTLSNMLFYQQDGCPLQVIETLGSHDPLLPRAIAADLKQRNVRTLHEIGPGNFNVAANILANNTAIQDYQAHDFSPSPRRYANVELPKDRFNFNLRSFGKFPEEVDDDPMNLLLIEVLDDVRTEFFQRHQGLESMLFVQPLMFRELAVFSRVRAGQILSQMGHFSEEATRMANAGIITQEKYTAAKIMDLIQTMDIDELKRIPPYFLKHIRYQQIPLQHPIEDLNTETWDFPEEANEYVTAMISYFKKQFEKTEEGHTLSLPVAALRLLYQLKDRKTHIDIFDYGYEQVGDIVAYTITQGQITAPVNFEILKFAAGWLGYEFVLEKNREFIRRHLGLDTVPLGYVTKALKENDNLLEIFRELFAPQIEALSGVAPDLDHITAYRILRGEADKFLHAAREQNLLKNEFSEGSYHMAIYRPQ